ncbi:hypothetical protein O3S80_27200 [Streptomyces sp. Lzd4kr]|nr:hypothetical protein [Streptomyces sp. Lzd4kr]
MATPTPAGAETPYSAAARLGCSVEQMGYCARCRGYCHRYGKGGNPLCATCREVVERGRSKRG